MNKDIAFFIFFIFTNCSLIFGQNEKDLNRLIDLSRNAYKNAQYEKALSYSIRSLEISRYLKNEHAMELCYYNIAAIYSELSNYNLALENYEKALLIARKYNKLSNIACCLQHIGLVYYIKGNQYKALENYKRALNICIDLDDREHSAEILIDLGEIYENFLNYSTALNYYTVALEVYKNLGLTSQFDRIINNIGLVYCEMGLYEKAIVNFEKVLQINVEQKDWDNIISDLGNIGSSYAAIGQYDKAIQILEEALKLRRKEKVPNDALDTKKYYKNTAIILCNIGIIYGIFGYFGESLKNLNEALQLTKDFNINEISVDILNNIGLAYLSQKIFDKAEVNFNEAEKCQNPNNEASKKNIAIVELYIATKRAKKALTILKEIKPGWNCSKPRLIQYHTQMAMALLGANKLKESSNEFYKAVELIENMRQKISIDKTGFLSSSHGGSRIRPFRGLVATLAERSLLEENQNFIHEAINVIVGFFKGIAISCGILKKDIYSDSNLFSAFGKNLCSAAFYFSESTKARVLLEQMANSLKSIAVPGVPDSVRNKENEFHSELAFLDEIEAAAYSTNKEIYIGHQKKRDSLQVEYDKFVIQLRNKYPKYASVMYPKPLKMEELQLKENELVLEYEITDEATYLFKIDTKKITLLKIKKSKEEMEAIIRDLMLPLQDCNRINEFSIFSSHQLYKLLLEKVLTDVKINTKIIIIPDGILGVVPFESLVVKSGKDYQTCTYVGDKYQLIYYQSTTAMALNRIRPPCQAYKPIFLLGNPIYNPKDPRYIAYKKNKFESSIAYGDIKQCAMQKLATHRDWGNTRAKESGNMLVYNPLPDTENEVRIIAKLYNVKSVPPDVLLNVYATETKLRASALQNYMYIHFATHADLPGKVQGINEPFLLLGQVENKGNDDGFLTLSEVMQLSLDADMVALSACLTGRGKVIEGEGVMNFARAFMQAGARSVLVSLWEAASKATAEFMVLFYQNLKQGKTKTEALFLARKSHRAKYPNPFYWAPFILYGER